MACACATLKYPACRNFSSTSSPPSRGDTPHGQILHGEPADSLRVLVASQQHDHCDFVRGRSGGGDHGREEVEGDEGEDEDLRAAFTLKAVRAAAVASPAGEAREGRAGGDGRSPRAAAGAVWTPRRDRRGWGAAREGVSGVGYDLYIQAGATGRPHPGRIAVGPPPSDSPFPVNTVPMEEEEDAQSSPPTSPSSGSSQRAGHANAGSSVLAVTVAAAPLQTLTLAVPISQHARVAGGDCWSEGATSVLIDAWGERYLELSRGNLRQKHWQEVADIVSARDDYTKPPKSDVQCKNRIDTLKKKYKLEKARAAASAAGPSKWAFFKRLDHLLGPNHHHPPNKTPPSSSSLPPPLPQPPLPKAKAAAAANHHHPHKPSPASNLPVAVPVGPRSFHHFQKKNHHHAQLPNPRSGTISSKTAAVAAAAAAAAASPDSSGSFPPKAVNGKKRKSGKEHPAPRVTTAHRAQDGGEGLRELTRAILNFGEVYERVESSKLQQVVEMERQRMGFVKELELQRMQFFMKTQMELTQLKRNGRAAAAAAAAAAANNNSNSDNTD
ncbi:hypothetical protein Taro_001692 [Colocasia esculenta]|uniref:Myb/SANT-like DNA-binding domain-containing protein n=1 Tax=Colocasia esculenta TaxID=4460 RepID=A0A843TIR5_COLES|nr:hypothetical protein [Colocasia esculenta]